jgi:hypothetical protein
MTLEQAQTVLRATDDMTGIEIALLKVIAALEKRVADLEKEKN